MIYEEPRRIDAIGTYSFLIQLLAQPDKNANRGANADKRKQNAKRLDHEPGAVRLNRPGFKATIVKRDSGDDRAHADCRLLHKCQERKKSGIDADP